MIVDDEAIFRERLLKSIKWDYYGFKVVCEAKNGLDALEKAGENQIDIAIVDISMPFMDGLQLSKHLKDKYPEIVIIIISAYNEFQYAKQAIKLGVNDYLTKPFDKEELILTLLKVKKEHETMKQKIKSEENYKKRLKEVLLNDLVEGAFDNNKEIIEQLVDCGIKFKSDRFKVVTMEISQLNEKWIRLKERSLWKFAISNIWDELLEEEHERFTFYGDDQRIISIIELKDNEEVDPLLYTKLHDLLKKYLDFSIVLGVGNTYLGLENIEKSYQESLVALQNRYKAKNEDVIFYKSLDFNESEIGFYSLLVNEELLMHLRMNEWELIVKKLSMIKKYIIENNISIDYTQGIYIAIISKCISFLEEHGGKVEEVFGNDFNPFAELKKKKSIEALDEWVQWMHKKAISFSQGNKVTKSKKLALSAKEYIDCNYSDVDMSVETIASQLYVNSGYLRSAFKQEIGVQISKYILNTRMEKAKELLKKKDIKIADITEMVGYSDAGYFSKVFKKYFGMTPSEFENIHKK